MNYIWLAARTTIKVLFIYPVATFFLVFASVLARFKRKKIMIGLGPEPLINNVYHKKALQSFNYTSETYVNHTYFITDEFDISLHKTIPKPFIRFINFYTFIFAVFRYECLYIYFNGGPLFSTSEYFRRLEPYLYKLSRTKIVVMPYGGDVSDTYTNKNLLFKFGLIQHYPDYCKETKKIQNQVIRWQHHASFVFSGCDWVDYTSYWNQLMLAHFSIDTESWNPVKKENSSVFRILHAPNHRLIKGTNFVIKTIENLRKQGLEIELILIEKKPNLEVKKEMLLADLVIDQLIIGWYAMFALEGMSLGKPVITYLRKDLIDLYKYAGLLEDEIPLISTEMSQLESTIKYYYQNRNELETIGVKSREFVKKYHSTQSIGKFFDDANKKIGLA